MAENQEPVDAKVNEQKNVESTKKQKKQMSDKTRYIILGVALGICVVAIVLACIFLTK